jgi:dolichol-phosphate mannosyltransferase
MFYHAIQSCNINHKHSKSQHLYNFIAKFKEGCDVVYGVRVKRKENILMRGLYKAYYRILSRLSEVPIPCDSGDCCLMSHKVVDLLNKMPERNRFIRGLRSWVGFAQSAVEYERDRRYAGRPKYTLFKLVKLGLDGIISFSGIPLKMSIVFGGFIAFASTIYSFIIILNRVFFPQNHIPGWASIVVGITFLGGVQLMVLGIAGEYISRIYDEVKGRPQYILSSLVGFEEDGDA